MNQEDLDLRSLRQQIRARRRALTDAERNAASQRLCTQIQTLDVFQNAQHIAGFLPFDGEIDPTAALKTARSMGKQTYLPVLLGKQRPMLFAPYTEASTFKKNWFNIPEPDVAQEDMIAPEQLDLVLTPLVAFDETGTRLGVGGGFYDRSFAFLLSEPRISKRTVLLGLAYELQKTTTPLPRRDWDVPLDAIITEADFYQHNTNKIP